MDTPEKAANQTQVSEERVADGSEEAKHELRNTSSKLPKFRIKESSKKVGRAIFARSKLSNEDIDIWDVPESSMPAITRNSMSTSPTRSNVGFTGTANRIVDGVELDVKLAGKKFKRNKPTLNIMTSNSVEAKDYLKTSLKKSLLTRGARALEAQRQILHTTLNR